MSKIQQFFELLNAGSDFDSAMRQAGISKSTARVQYGKWKKTKSGQKGGKVTKKEEDDGEDIFLEDKEEK